MKAVLRTDGSDVGYERQKGAKDDAGFVRGSSGEDAGRAGLEEFRFGRMMFEVKDQEN